MGFIEAIRGAEVISSPLGLDILCMMGMVKSAAPGRYVLVVPLDDLWDESGKTEDAQPDLSSQPMSMETEVPPTAKETPSMFAHTSPRAYNRLERFDSAVGLL